MFCDILFYFLSRYIILVEMCAYNVVIELLEKIWKNTNRI